MANARSIDYNIWVKQNNQHARTRLYFITVFITYSVHVYDIDFFEYGDMIPVLHAAGRAVVCHFSTQYENYRIGMHQKCIYETPLLYFPFFV